MLEQARSTVGHRSPHQWGFPQCRWRNPVKLLPIVWRQEREQNQPFSLNCETTYVALPQSQDPRQAQAGAGKGTLLPSPCLTRQGMTKRKAVCALSSPILWQGSERLDDTFTAACAASCLPVFHLHSSSSANWHQLLQFQILLSRNIDTTTLWLESTLPNASQFCTAQMKSSCREKGQFPEHTE